MIKVEIDRIDGDAQLAYMQNGIERVPYPGWPLI